jgi:hypothetical protein
MSYLMGCVLCMHVRICVNVNVSVHVHVHVNVDFHKCMGCVYMGMARYVTHNLCMCAHMNICM